MTKISVREFETKVWELESVSLTVHAPLSSLVDDYDFKNKAAATSSLAEWVENRIKTRVGDLEFSVIDADYSVKTPHGRTNLGTLRDRYKN